MPASELLRSRHTAPSIDVEVMRSTRLRKRSGLSRLGYWLVPLLVVGLWPMTSGMRDLESAWADEPPSSLTSKDQAPVEPDMEEERANGANPEGPSETEGPQKQPRFLPPRLRPKVLTSEEQAEAERLKKLAAKYGTDPTAIIGRGQLSTQYADLSHGAHARDSTLRVDLPFRGNWLFRVDVPFLKWTDPNRPGITGTQGMSDLLTVAGWRAYNTPEYAFFIGVLSSFPTAEQPTLGLGKYTVGPLIATARFLPRWESFLFGVFQHQLSVGGDPSRKDVSLTRAALQINTIWADRWWTIAQAQWQIDWERNAKSSMTFEFEVGRSLVGRLGAYVRPGVGIWGQDLIGAYQWNIEVGVRYMFGSL